MSPVTEIEVLPAAASALAPAQPQALESRSSGSTTRFLLLAAIVLVLLAGSAVIAWQAGLLAPSAEATSAEAANGAGLESAGTAANGNGVGPATAASAAGLAAVTEEEGASMALEDTPSGTAEGDAVGVDASPAGSSDARPEGSTVGATQTPGSFDPAGGASASGNANLPAAGSALSAANESSGAGQSTGAVGRPAATVPETGTAVVTVGNDPTLAAEVEAYLEQRLSSAGVELVDEKGLPGIWDLQASGSAGSDQLISALRYEARHVIVARVDLVGERDLQYLGRYQRAYQSRVTVQSVDSATDRPILPSRSATVEYTQVEPERAVRTALGPIALELIQSLER